MPAQGSPQPQSLRHPKSTRHALPDARRGTFPRHSSRQASTPVVKDQMASNYFTEISSAFVARQDVATLFGNTACSSQVSSCSISNHLPKPGKRIYQQPHGECKMIGKRGKIGLPYPREAKQ